MKLLRKESLIFCIEYKLWIGYNNLMNIKQVYRAMEPKLYLSHSK